MGKVSTMKDDIAVRVIVDGLEDHGFGNDKWEKVTFIPGYAHQSNVPGLAALCLEVAARTVEDYLNKQIQPQFPAPAGVDYER